MIVFISCVKSKRDCRCRAEDMYVSDLFRKSLAYAKTLDADRIFILSAKYGVLELSDVIDPYELTLNAMGERERKVWAYRVCKQLEAKGIRYDERAVFLCGINYRKWLVKKFKNNTIPLEGLSIGRQLQFYKNQVRKPQ